MMCEHLEGISSGGTTHLATGVAVCSAGTLRYHKRAVSSACADAGNTASARETRSCHKDNSEVSLSLREGGEQDVEVNEAASARAAVIALLRQCQRAALLDSKNTNDSGRGTARAPVPLLFIVVENPKTPANAGGVLRAMKCYGVHGPAVTSHAAATAAGRTPQDEKEGKRATPSSTTKAGLDVHTATFGVDSPPPRSDDADDGVLQRVGAFIFSGTRLQKALGHTDFAGTLRTDPTHASRDIPQLCLPTLDGLFDVLRSEFGHDASATAPPSSSPVRVVAVELVEGATLLPAFEHPFNYTESGDVSSSSSSAKSIRDTAAARQESATLTDSAAAAAEGCVPMVFYVFGAEDGTLAAHHLARDVDDVVFMPTAGSMNLAATVNVLLYDRAAKERCGLRPAERETGKKWKGVFEGRNANNRTRWTRPS
ncbi:hypothetical protein ABB37_07136 [Leptomonas pyrrhocoris]|uniref:tRNA/rRNA methyltransferase SpoU type domain-containing protein n=1 Tax=Leptomonas pyrrhocoris TaxID=157538 RepID=A0A0M9FW77_LEPPY|nr:hypothetical protein ABB37_07136 [Leptomonas pyrrhocoris]KPA77229.1 hypothetical protein ABB37_07136 [Leptomonas pyrrhocoris]|eukprot:XP_015655668.1 hypothetical protein ABB37_07136 [Leptomonas pyrrhocoris]